jgi:F420-dependent oxidoreductase-like protein
MAEISIMVEGQDGLSWPRWQRLVQATEDLGFDGLYRSDHFSNPQGPFLDALELWVSFTWLAANTSRIRFGAMVSPVSFRDPVLLAWQASGVDALAGGRLDIGLGAGWQEREHSAFGYDLLDLKGRFNRFEEALQVIRVLTRSSTPVSFNGEYYRLQEAQLLPRSPQVDGPPITIGGTGPKRTLPLVAKYADEWNFNNRTVEEYLELNSRLNALLDRQGRPRTAVRRSMASALSIGASDADVARKLDGRDKADLISRGHFAGTPDEVTANLQRYVDQGVDGFKIRLLDLDDISSLELLASQVLPHFR